MMAIVVQKNLDPVTVDQDLWVSSLAMIPLLQRVHQERLSDRRTAVQLIHTRDAPRWPVER